MSGSWEVVIGEQDTFGVSHLRYATLFVIPVLTVHAVHILEYENYDGYDKTVAKIRNSDVRA